MQKMLEAFDSVGDWVFLPGFLFCLFAGMVVLSALMLNPSPQVVSMFGAMKLHAEEQRNFTFIGRLGLAGVLMTALFWLYCWFQVWSEGRAQAKPGNKKQVKPRMQMRSEPLPSAGAPRPAQAAVPEVEAAKPLMSLAESQQLWQSQTKSQPKIRPMSSETMRINRVVASLHSLSADELFFLAHCLYTDSIQMQVYIGNPTVQTLVSKGILKASQLLEMSGGQGLAELDAFALVHLIDNRELFIDQSKILSMPSEERDRRWRQVSLLG